MSKLILHVDLDQFFVAVEVRNNPSLKGKCVAVGGGSNGRGIITSASYEARRFGLRAGMSALDARRLCPQVIFVRGNTSAYIHTSKNIKAILQGYTNKVEMLSVDEACLDVTDTIWSYPSVGALAEQIRAHIRESEGVVASVGAGANRMVAKMACNLCKPNGVLHLPPAKVAGAYNHLPVGKLVGVGRATEHACHLLGISTIGDLAAYPVDILKTRFGIRGRDLQRLARGGGNDVVMTPDELPDEKSIGHEMTFGENLKTPEAVEAKLLMLIEKVTRRMRVAGWAGRVVSLKVRYHGMETHIHEHKFARPLWCEGDLFQAGCKLLKEMYDPARPVRLIGISVSDLVPALRIQQQELFEAKTDLRALATACDDVRDKFGEAVIGFASSMLAPGKGRSNHNLSAYRVIPFRIDGMMRT